MRRTAIVLTALLLTPVFFQSANAATGSSESGRGGSTTSGARTFRPGGSGIPHAGIPPTGIPRSGIPHTDVGRTGIPHSQFTRPGFARRGPGRPGFRGGIGSGVIIGAPLLEPIDPFTSYDSYAYPYGVPEYATPYPPEVYAAPEPYLPPATVYAPGAGQEPPQQIWYYCQDPMGYYPYVQNCNSNWQAVPASVLPPPTPQQ